MGCGASTPDEDRPCRPAPNDDEIDVISLPLPDVTWQQDQSWTEQIATLESQAIEQGRHDEFRTNYEATIFELAQDRLAMDYPECARAGTIDRRDGGVDDVYPSMRLLCLDDSFGGIVYATALVVAKPLASPADKTDRSQPCVVAGEELASESMRFAKFQSLKTLSMLRAKGVNVGHSWIYIFVGVDMVKCRLDASVKPPTILRRPDGSNASFKKVNNKVYKKIAKDARRHPDKFEGKCASLAFKIQLMAKRSYYPGCTVWDHGKLAFDMDGKPYPEPTRLLVARDYASPTVKEVDAAVCRLRFAIDDGDQERDHRDAKVLRSLDPTTDPGGIVAVTLLVASPRSVIWPDFGTYVESPAIIAAEQAAQQYVKDLHAQGKVQRCDIWVCMGFDRSRFIFIGDPIDQGINDGDGEQVLGREGSQTMAVLVPADDNSLEGDFGVKIELQAKHELFTSEMQFQAVKEHMRTRYENLSPAELRAREVAIAPMVGRHFLEQNFPHCEISDEGPFPAILPDGSETLICDARLLVARDARQAPKSIIAAFMVAPPPREDGDSFLLSRKSWLDTPYMKAADDMLLAVLKTRHAQGLVSEVDCMAQVMMGMDATIYRFVDGERFEDYSDERMSQVKWG